MQQRRTSPEAIIHRLSQADTLISRVHPVREATKKIGVAQHTDYRWHKAYGGMDSRQMLRLKQLERDNALLRPRLCLHPFLWRQE